jgi:hypothetical protein
MFIDEYETPEDGQAPQLERTSDMTSAPDWTHKHADQLTDHG